MEPYNRPYFRRLNWSIPNAGFFEQWLAKIFGKVRIIETDYAKMEVLERGNRYYLCQEQQKRRL